MMGQFTTWQENEEKEQMALLEGRHIFGVLAKDSDYILSEGLTDLKMDTLESFLVTDSNGHRRWEFLTRLKN
jgi:hypothetical protein